nr:RNA-directed DNA polymerase, eukaryota, reverse transcriptase zinc-binding domain protein [Tanacetum cinerariifolium]
MLLFKIVFEKAFDSVSWRYLDFMLCNPRFRITWRTWIKACLKSSPTLILVNGSLTSEFNGLHVAISDSVRTGLIRGIKIGSSDVNLSYLFFADDVIIMSDWNSHDVENIIRIFKVFFLNLGLKINIIKSSIYGVGVPPEEMHHMAPDTGCSVGSFPITYLGLSIGSNTSLTPNWKLLVDKFHSKLSSWKASLLSYGGHLTLLKTVLGSLEDCGSRDLWKVCEGYGKVVKLSYLGGLWVMIELENEISKSSLLDHVGVKSWFHSMQEATQDFVSEERVVWVDIKGVPFNLWSRETFLKIRSKWGSALDIEDNSGSSFACKRICVLTKEPDSILEKFKVIYKGKVSMVRAKELFTWTLFFLEPQEMVYTSDGDSVQGDKSKLDDAQLSDGESDEESDVDGVSETVFGENSSSHHVSGRDTDIQQSEDPFCLYDLLKKHPVGGNCAESPSLSHPPRFTPDVSKVHKNGGGEDDTISNDVEKEKTPSVHANVMNTNIKVTESSIGESTSIRTGPVHNGGSILDVLEDMVRVGHSMGYNFEGCMKDIESIIGAQGVKEVASQDAAQKSKIKWAIEGDENSKFFHGIINKKRSYLSIRGVFVDGIWCTDPVVDMDSNVSWNEIRRAVWDCGDNKSPGPDGYSFEFFRKYWSFIGPDFCCAVEHFFEHGSFSKGCNSSFIALIPKVSD